jgi:hypothetical protein
MAFFLHSRRVVGAALRSPGRVCPAKKGVMKYLPPVESQSALTFLNDSLSLQSGVEAGMCRATRRTVDIPRNCVWARQWSVANCKEIRRRRVCCTSGRFIRYSMSDPLASAATRSWGRCCPSIPSCEQRYVDGGVIRQHPPLEHDTAEAGHFQAITVRSQPARVGVGFAMHAVKCDKLPQICKQRGPPFSCCVGERRAHDLLNHLIGAQERSVGRMVRSSARAVTPPVGLCGRPPRTRQLRRRQR